MKTNEKPELTVAPRERVFNTSMAAAMMLIVRRDQDRATELLTRINETFTSTPSAPREVYHGIIGEYVELKNMNNEN